MCLVLILHLAVKKMLKIGQYFVKLLTSEQNTHFFGPPCILTLWYFYLSYFLHYFMPNLWGHWMDLDHTWTNNCYLKNLVQIPLGIYPPTGWEEGGAKTLFWDQPWTLTMLHTMSLQWNMISTIGKKHVNLQGLPYIPQLWWTLVQKVWLRTVGEFLPTPKFSHGETLPALPHGLNSGYTTTTESRQTLARDM